MNKYTPEDLFMSEIGHATIRFMIEVNNTESLADLDKSLLNAELLEMLQRYLNLLYKQPTYAIEKR